MSMAGSRKITTMLFQGAWFTMRGFGTKRLAFQVVHPHVRAGAINTTVIHVDDIGTLDQFSCLSGFTLNSDEGIRVFREVGVEYFERDGRLPVGSGVFCLEDHAHTTRTHTFQQYEPAAAVFPQRANLVTRMEEFGTIGEDACLLVP